MTLKAPNLDSRTFTDLIDEAKNRIPRYTVEWTNFNSSDPGMTLVELHAWMTETLLYEMNRVPELNYVKFLDLLGIIPEPAHPARTELSFTLDKLDKPIDKLVIPVPLATQVAVDDDEIKTNITFETDRSLLALNARIGVAIAPVDNGAQTRALVTAYEKDVSWLHSFDPFTKVPAAERCLYIGLLLRPTLKEALEKYLTDALPAGPLDLYADAVQVYDDAPDDTLVTGPLDFVCASAQSPAPKVEWQIWTGADTSATFDDASDTGWTPLSLSYDQSGGLVTSGHLVLEVPPHATALSPRQIDADFWTSLVQNKPPVNFDELKSAIGTLDILEALGDHWVAMGLGNTDDDEGDDIDSSDLALIMACGSDAAAAITVLDALALAERPDPGKLTAAIWAAIDPAFEAPLPMEAEEFRTLYWLRAKLKALPPTEARAVSTIRAFRLNTVTATQAATRLEDRIGISNGRPGQTAQLPQLPVLIDPGTGTPDLALSVEAEMDWIRVNDFFNSSPGSKHYLLNPDTGIISFGDGLRGRIPVAGAAFLATRYRTGGGGIGNVGTGTISKLKGRLNGVKSVTNLRPAHDGSDAETLDTVKLRAPHELRHRDRAVSSQDFSDLALRTPGVALHRALALPRRALQNGVLVDRDGAVTLVLLPLNDHPMPQPTEGQLQAVCRWLEPRRLVTTELHLTGPTYATVTQLTLRIGIEDDADIPAVSEAVYATLLRFLHPITGGANGDGWEFGSAIYSADVYERVLKVPGVARASALGLAVAGGVFDIDTDVTTLPPGALPALSRDRIALVASYV